MTITTLEDFAKFLILKKPIIGIDYGLKKTGLAISNPEHTVAIPLKIILTQENIFFEKLLKIIHDFSACAIVIGLPISMNGTTNKQTENIMNFTKMLNRMITLPIYLQDERLTSKAADKLLKSLGFKRKIRNKHDDLIAASMILETTLNSIQKF